MSSTRHFQIFIDSEHKHQSTPDASAGYELVLSEQLAGWGAAEGTSIMHPIITIKRDGELALPQTFTFVIDGQALQIGKPYRATLRYKVNTKEPHDRNDRMLGELDFSLADNATLQMSLQQGHGPCLGQTMSCFGW